MDLRIKVQPRVVTGRTKADLESKINALVGLKRSTNIGRVNKHGDLVGINYQKHRKKVRRVSGKKTVVLHPNHWIGYVYVFPADILRMLQCYDIYQGKRGFRFRKKR